MATHQYQMLFNCTPAQFLVAMATTLPGVGFQVIQAPNKFNGIIKGNTGASTGLGQVDYQYDGNAFLRFFGANVIPVAQQAQAGIPGNQISTQLTTELTTALAATLGAPVPLNSNNPSNAANA